MSITVIIHDTQTDEQFSHEFKSAIQFEAYRLATNANFPFRYRYLIPAGQDKKKGGE